MLCRNAKCDLISVPMNISESFGLRLKFVTVQVTGAFFTNYRLRILDSLRIQSCDKYLDTNRGLNM